MKKVKYIAILFLLAVTVISGCKKKNGGAENDPADGIVDKSVVDTTYKVYYLNEDHIHLEGVPVIYTSETPEQLIEECMKSLMSQPDDVTLKRTIPEDVLVQDAVYDPVTKQVDIYFSSSYGDIPKIEEILVRAGIVKTLTQFDGVIDYVQFFVDGSPLTESDGQKMIMMQSDFVENTMADVKRLNQGTIRLYFSSSDGTKLVAEEVYIHYSKAYSLEKVILESLIAGPISKSLNPTLSSDVKIYDDVSVVDGICYVDFNQRFLDRINDQSFALNVYSVVNSLTELDYISGVQIKIDGEIVAGNDANISLAAPLERNEELIVKSSDTPPVVESSMQTESEALNEDAKTMETYKPSDSETKQEAVPETAAP